MSFISRFPGKVFVFDKIVNTLKNPPSLDVGFMKSRKQLDYFIYADQGIMIFPLTRAGKKGYKYCHLSGIHENVPLYLEKRVCVPCVRIPFSLPGVKVKKSFLDHVILLNFVQKAHGNIV